MAVTKCTAIFRKRRNLLQLSVASALAATGMLVTAPGADARITKIDITSRTTVPHCLAR
jgi:hypothetical protein